ncbi:MAG: YncE family protein [Spirochaetales bacterium]|nr:YncE family protein [Spirochaetales bacterium]
MGGISGKGLLFLPVLFFLAGTVLTAQSSLVPLTLRHFPLDSQVLLDGIPLQPDETEWDGEYRTFYVRTGLHSLTVRAEGYVDESYPLNLGGQGEYIEDKLEKAGLPVSRLEELPTSYQPKSVTFSPDGRYMAVASLGSGRGVEIFTLHPFAPVKELIPEARLAGKKGFVETCWLPDRKELWVSQMTTNMFHVFSTEDWSCLGSFPAGGAWPKVLLSSPDESRVYISNWESETVTEIDTQSREVIRTFPVSGIPRGLSFTGDGNTLVVAIYSANALDYVNLTNGETRTVTYSGHSGAMRHLVHDSRRGLHYVTNMQLGLVYALSETNGDVRKIYRVGQKPNTAAMSPDGRFLFVSCRGPNNPITYLIEGHEYGKVYIIDLEEQQVIGWLWGRDQTTGLDVSPDSRYLAFTDFKEDILELYRIDRGDLALWKE